MVKREVRSKEDILNFKGKIMLQGVKVRLVPPKKEYIDRFQKWMTDPEITQYLRVFRPITREMEEDWYNSMIKRENNILFSIVIPDDENNDILIGNCDIDVDWKNRVGNVGIVIGEKECHGKGYGTEAMKLLVDYGFTTLNLNRIELETHGFNLRALKTYTKLGFKKEVTRRHAVYINGVYHDSIMLSILRDEWQRKK
ncbi:MAG: GNAT family N-acetyltransferase [Candidatus Lokiarchaeota archaeon]|nr:GNAT family N-acetyltransferase [Candidatus Lokiarchaeota archaeon]